MRARLLLAFFGITAFAVLAAAAGIYAFQQVGSRLDVVESRIPSTLSALELSRSAERIIAAAPALLVATDRKRRDEVKTVLTAEVERLNAGLENLRGSEIDPVPLVRIESSVSSLTANLDALEDLVARRLETRERIIVLQRGVFKTNEDIGRLLAPWLEVVGSEIATLVGNRNEGTTVPVTPSRRLASLLEVQRLMRSAQVRVSAVADMLVEASTTDRPRRLPVLAFQLRRALDDLKGTAAGFDPRLRPLFLEQVAKLQEFTEGPKAITDARKEELALVEEGKRMLGEMDEPSTRLAAAVERLGRAAKLDISGAIRDAVSLQRRSTHALMAVVALGLFTSILIVWLYVGKSIARRLTALSHSMITITGGSLDTPVNVEGTDEIAAMGRAVEIFRKNTLERNELLTERAQAADRLENEVQQRTAELTQSVKELRALGEVSQAVNSTVDLETVLTTIVAKATQLSNTEAGAIYVFDDATREFQLRATYGMSDEIIAEIRKRRPGLGETTVGEAVERGVPIQIPDARNNPPFPVPDIIVCAGYRALLFVPLIGAKQVIGALVVRSRQPGEFSGATVELLQTFAAQSVLAIQNARLFEESRDKSRQLEVANRYKSHFLASASHDLRQPLHALNLFINQLRTNADPEEGERLIERIDAAVGSMNELFEALLDMAKLEAGVLEPNLTEFPMKRLFKRVETTFADAASEKGLRLAVIPCGVWVRSDFVLLERVLFNLVSNALRYVARGGVVVGGRRRGEQLRIDIWDTGPGIPEDQQRNVFGDLYQLAGSGHQGGLGHGLAIVNRLAHLLDHEVELHSRPGRGTRFSVWVPLVDEHRIPDDASAPPVVADPVRDKLVVVIDDDPLVLEGMGGTLRAWGCEVLAADSQEQALSQITARGQWPDLIIADYQLDNGRTGVDAILRLRDLAGAAIPAFLISGDTAPERLRDAGKKGLHLLHKPVPAMRLRAMVNQFVMPDRTVGAPAPSGHSHS